MMNMITIYMLSGTVLSALIAAARDRSVILWAVLGIIAGPIAVAIVMWLPSRRPVPVSPYPPNAVRSLADEIEALDNLRQRGMISEAEYEQGKAQILAWPVSSPIPLALSPQRVIADGRRTWASYQQATRTAFSDLARRHRLQLRWLDDVPYEVAATYPVQPGLSLEFTLALEKGMIHLWGDGWNLDGVEIGPPEAGLPHGLDAVLDALIDGTGRVVIRTSRGSSTPFSVSLQMTSEGRWRTVSRRGSLPWPPLWRRRIMMNNVVEAGQS
jgi:hypothetical protein